MLLNLLVELIVGERVQSLTTDDGFITSITPRGPPEPVFNLEVDTQHVYNVGHFGLLVHNVCSKRNLSKQVKKLAEANITNTGTTSLGTYPSYLEKPAKLRTSHFNIGSIWDTMTIYHRWKANRHFLNKIAKRKDRIILSIPDNTFNLHSWLAEELKYMTQKNNHIYNDPETLVPRE